MRIYPFLGVAAALLAFPQLLAAQTQDSSGLTIFPQSPSLEQILPPSAFQDSYEYVGEVEYFDDPVVDPVVIRRSRRVIVPYRTLVPFSYRFRRSPGVIVQFGAPIPKRRFYTQPFRNYYPYRFRH
jgi:hypothetical protein